MKKLLAILLVLTFAISMAACGGGDDPAKKSEGVMTYAEYNAAALDTEVVIEAYVQGNQAWWEKDGQGVITLYLQDPDGAYFAYECKCSAEDAAKLAVGTKVKISGYKGAWEGEIEIMDGTLEILEGNWVAETMDATALLGTEDLINHQNKKVVFKGLTVEAIAYKNDAPGDDIYVTVSKDGASYDFCVEAYLTGPDTEVYSAVGALTAGQTVDIEAFLYWYAGPNPHITAVTVVQ